MNYIIRRFTIDLKTGAIEGVRSYSCLARNRGHAYDFIDALPEAVDTLQQCTLDFAIPQTALWSERDNFLGLTNYLTTQGVRLWRNVDVPNYNWVAWECPKFKQVMIARFDAGTQQSNIVALRSNLSRCSIAHGSHDLLEDYLAYINHPENKTVEDPLRHVFRINTHEVFRGIGSRPFIYPMDY